jgi:hypothetical protein
MAEANGVGRLIVAFVFLVVIPSAASEPAIFRSSLELSENTGSKPICGHGRYCGDPSGQQVPRCARNDNQKNKGKLLC